MNDTMLAPAAETKSPKRKANFRDPVREAIAVQSLRESIGALEGDDELLLDTIEGETELFEIIDLILARINDSNIMVDGIKAAIDGLEVRKARYAKRAQMDKALIEQALMTADLDMTIERPMATLYLSNRAQQLIVETEADIPAQYWKAGSPTLDRKALLDALKARSTALKAIPDDPDARAAALASLPPEIPGVTLSNGGRSLSMRTK